RGRNPCWTHSWRDWRVRYRTPVFESRGVFGCGRGVNVFRIYPRRKNRLGPDSGRGSQLSSSGSGVFVLREVCAHRAQGRSYGRTSAGKRFSLLRPGLGGHGVAEPQPKDRARARARTSREIAEKGRECQFPTAALESGMGPSQFDHEKLDVYRLELKFLAWVTQFLADLCGASQQCWFAPWLCLPNCWSVLILN